MPGHIKKAKEGEVDPDPLPYLVVTIEMKRADAQIPYDPKKSYYCPDGKHGYMECMLESIEGKRGLPRNRPPFPAQSGLFGRPTLINNVETTYWIPEILEKGADWYQKKGRPHFFSVSGRVRSPGIKLAPAGITAQELIFDHSDGMLESHEFTAFLPGGASGGLLPASKSDLPLDFGSLDDVGCFIGSSAVVVFSQFDTIPSICRNLVHFFEETS